jgi:hypothetical protein
MCRAAGRRLLADMSTEEREVNAQLGEEAPDLTDPRQVVAYVAVSLMTERRSFDVTVDDVERRVKELAAAARAGLRVVGGGR